MRASERLIAKILDFFGGEFRDAQQTLRPEDLPDPTESELLSDKSLTTSHHLN